MPINRFRGQFYFLSNFYPCNHGVEFDGDLYPTSEHAYQAAKIEERVGRESFTITGSLGQSGPMVAKMKGKHVNKRPSWDSNKVKFMEIIVRSKFARDPKLIQNLLDTGDQKIVEGHTGDKFWGGKANHLGNILMKVREEFRSVGPRFQETAAEESDTVKPQRKQCKGRTFEVLFVYGDVPFFMYPDLTEEFGCIIERWCLKYNDGANHGLHQFHVMDPEGVSQAVDLECHLFDYADINRQVIIKVGNIEAPCAEQGQDMNIEQPEQQEGRESNFPNQFKAWLREALREEVDEASADALEDCMKVILKGVDAQAPDMVVEALADAAEALRGGGAEKTAACIHEKWDLASS